MSTARLAQELAAHLDYVLEFNADHINEFGPATAYPSTVSTPAGTWSLFVRDDAFGDSRSITSWGVQLDVVGGVGGRVSATCTVWAIHGDTSYASCQLGILAVRRFP